MEAIKILDEEIGSFWLVLVVLLKQIQTLPVLGVPVQRASVAIYQNGPCLMWLKWTYCRPNIQVEWAPIIV